ncbi:plasmid mobilization relaxosome protein MobC [Shigella sonnei]|jgi:metal-responsive CopG/Arc/MetJ family transcriptional regulator|uniref:Plasmid mobilization relaxosome protein MobC n=5 Tax=Enterobacteriaceae TaxID=543 RepID=A0A2P9ELA0_ECOLX|nr:plasmid mobilization relaxosome protein MobC [Shigella sonnei]EAA2477795.1 plasmid mobilization relaxosome protein MobC [Shigella flexneri]EBS4265172.1 plasmid mobilization relaxosome protein MobC [Salmonella enterica subsp. enterica serovar Schwarzengrund]EEC7356396.1 plasmid mobilization relaxosome protein MobC [Escherichia coli]EFK17988.1 bacterial mobilization protein MobC [Escherichia coli MS 21-1]EFP8425749.1 plasmid mobilization relaxosome protein MobC [Shigella dysenteriae]ELP28677
MEVLRTMKKQDKGKKAVASTSKVERKHVISLRLTDEEYQSFHEYFTSLEVSRSEFFRMVILNRLDDIPTLKQKRPVEYRELLRLFNKSSNNINQIAKKINTEYRNGFISESTYLRYLNVLVNIRDAFVAGINKC